MSKNINLKNNLTKNSFEIRIKNQMLILKDYYKY